MRILVIGASGQVGRCLLAAATPELNLIGTTRADVDLTKPDSVHATITRHRPDCVINAAAYTAVDKAESERDLAYAINADAVGHMAEASAMFGVPLLHISTDYVFDGSGTRRHVETDPTAPLGVYGASKLAGEVLAHTKNPAHVILRTSWVYAAHGTNFIRTMQRLGRERDEVRVVADQHGAPTAADDIASALIAIARRLHDAPAAERTALYGTYHYTARGETTWHGLAEVVFEDLQRTSGRRPRCIPVTTAEYPTPARRPANSRLDCRKFDGVFGAPRPEWRASVDRMLATTV